MFPEEEKKEKKKREEEKKHFMVQRKQVSSTVAWLQPQPLTSDAQLVPEEEKREREK